MKVRVMPTGRWKWRLILDRGQSFGSLVVGYVYGSRDRAERKARQLLEDERRRSERIRQRRRVPFEVREEGADP